MGFEMCYDSCGVPQGDASSYNNAKQSWVAKPALCSPYSALINLQKHR